MTKTSLRDQGQNMLRPPQENRVQKRAQLRKADIENAVVRVLGDRGASKMTHRLIANLAGVPLAATTYYYADKGAILLAASDQLLDRVTKDVTGRPGLAARPLANRIILALAAKPALFCAWAELMLYSARGSEGYRIGTQ